MRRAEWQGMLGLVIAGSVAVCATPVAAAEWTERYFGVGSAGDRSLACGQARDHAQGNSFKACLDRRGKRGEAEYTECVCAAAADRMHVCNVNLKVRCDASDEGASKERGTPRERAGRGGRSMRPRRPASEALPAGPR